MARQPKKPEELAMKFSISIMPEDYKRLMSYCEKEERQASWVIRKALRQWLDEHDVK